jgi:hypothetical protein
MKDRGCAYRRKPIYWKKNETVLFQQRLMPLTVPNILALWGAIPSTVVLVWDIAKWHMSGPKFRLTVNPGCERFQYPGIRGQNPHHGLRCELRRSSYDTYAHGVDAVCESMEAASE